MTESRSALPGNRVLTAPHYGTPAWTGYRLGTELSRRLGRNPPKLINEAGTQGLWCPRDAVSKLVRTLGTGAGTALFLHGDLGAAS